MYTFTYPAQEQKLGKDPIDQATLRDAGELFSHDRDARELELKRGPKLDDVPLPRGAAPGRPVQHEGAGGRARADRRARCSRDDGRYPAIESVLRREPFDRDVQTNDLEEMTELLLSLDGRHLVIQGPPGSGKTCTSGRLIARLIAAGKTVGVASTSHRAIHKLLEEVVEAAAELGIAFRGLKKASDSQESRYPGDGIENVFDNDDCHDCELLGGTAWLFADGQHDGQLDYLFIDEAGQVSLADALAMGTSARQRRARRRPAAARPGAAGIAPGRERGVGARAPARRRARRSRPTAASSSRRRTGCTRTSAASSRRSSTRAGCSPIRSRRRARRRSAPACAGSPSSTKATGRSRRRRPQRCASRSSGSRRRASALDEIKVVAPYNAQVDRLRAVLPAAVEVGTVDKFQGQEARVVFYSMASSSGEDVPRGLDFLFSRNRFNVAISRAQCLAYLVCSPRLLEVDCRTIDHMRLANALCRFVELAR